MKVLVACKFSGIVREAFSRLGHNAWSCDLLPTEIQGNHFQCDIFDVLKLKWDLLIAHPPCTYLAVSGNRYYANTELRKEAILFVEKLWDAPIERICIENPIGVLSTQSRLGKPTQYIQPYQFGHPESKNTCLWLKNLPELVPTNILPLPEKGYWDNQTPSGQNKLGPSPDRAKNRSRTYQGIANAMAGMWNNF